ncbi:MAG: hypothetical protein PVF74_08445 [Anaerolineales bacterium]
MPKTVVVCAFAAWQGTGAICSPCTLPRRGADPLPVASQGGFADRLGSLLSPFGLTFRRCKIHFMLRAAVLLSLLRRLHRFSTTSHPAALDACYLAA